MQRKNMFKKSIYCKNTKACTGMIEWEEDTGWDTQETSTLLVRFILEFFVHSIIFFILSWLSCISHILRLRRGQLSIYCRPQITWFFKASQVLLWTYTAVSLGVVSKKICKYWFINMSFSVSFEFLRSRCLNGIRHARD